MSEANSDFSPLKPHWSKVCTNALSKYHKIRAKFPLSIEDHFTIVPKGNNISREMLEWRFRQFIIYLELDACLYVYEVSKAGVAHIHGIMFRTLRAQCQKFAEHFGLTYLTKKGPLRGWIIYFMKDNDKFESFTNGLYKERIIDDYINNRDVIALQRKAGV